MIIKRYGIHVKRILVWDMLSNEKRNEKQKKKKMKSSVANGSDQSAQP